MKAIFIFFLLSTSLWAKTFVAFTDYGRAAYSEAGLKKYREFEKATGLNTLDILFTCYTENETSHNIDCKSDDSPYWSRVESVISQAKKDGKEVTLRFYVDLRNGKWRAFWKPKKKLQAFNQLEKHLTYIAEKAATLNVDNLFIGSELEGLTIKGNLIHWITLIGKIKRVYRGKILYAANGNINKRKIPEYQWVPFWSLLNSIAINYYPPNEGPVKERTLRIHHKRKLGLLKKFASEKQQKLIISEVGFPLAAEGLKKPYEWRYSKKAKKDPLSRAMSVRLFLEVAKELEISQIHFWRFYPEEASENPLGYLWDKKQMEILKK